MPILEDIMDHDIFGPGLRKARAEGLADGERRILRRQIADRFGSVPEWATARIEALAEAELEDLAVRVIHAGSLEELLRSYPQS